MSIEGRHAFIKINNQLYFYRFLGYTLRKRIIKLLKEVSITNKEEKERLEELIKTKKWNPYCIRHSAITADSDNLPEYTLKKKVRWSMNSKQGSRYIKSRWVMNLKIKYLHMMEL
jgi:integrase/recombinase XerD